MEDLLKSDGVGSGVVMQLELDGPNARDQHRLTCRALEMRIDSVR
jgi:hypothetical protein